MRESMTACLNFTKTVLDKLTSADKIYSVRDIKVRGLRLYIFPSNIKTFVLYRKINDRPQRIKIGRYEDFSIESARKEAEKLNASIAKGIDPSERSKAKKQEITFQELYERYYHDYAIHHTKRPDDNKKMLEFHILPKYGRLKLKDFNFELTRKMHTQIGADRGQVLANRVMTLVSAVFNYGIKNGYHKLVNPCFGLKKYKEFSRDRFLSKDELKLFFEALRSESILFQDYFLLLLYTGARKSNVLAMKWVDIDLNIMRWRLSESETKNNDVNIVYLSDTSLEILKRRKLINESLQDPSPYVFPSLGKNGHLVDPKRAFQRIRERMQAKDFRMHDLRRTLASYMAISGTSLNIIGKALNHKSQISTAIYARLDRAPVLNAINEATQLMVY